MQPIVYLAVRVLLSWIQFIERSSRAYLNDPLVLIAAGAVHCWAVVYSLFLAVHTRAMRFHGYHEGFVEHLPSSVAFAETLAVGSLWVWFIAGFTTATVRILDEDADGLPMELGDTKMGPIVKFMRSSMLHRTLGNAHSVSCCGLFSSILLLCVTMATMKGGITVCEASLILVSCSFALPHAVLAVRRLSDTLDDLLETLIPEGMAEAAAAEASAIGPQLCIILALADAPGHAYWWQNLVYSASSMALILAVTACAQCPPRPSDASLPPEAPESFVCMVLHVVAALSIVLSYPHLNTWFLWISVVGIIALAAAAPLPAARDFYMEWLEPIFPLRSDTHKRRKNQQRDLLRQLAWLFGLLCATTGLWDIIWHPVNLSSSYLHRADEGLPSTLMLRWKVTTAAEKQEPSQLLEMAAVALNLDKSTLMVEQNIPEHRLMLFKYAGVNDGTEAMTALLQWKAAMVSPQGSLAEVVDTTFPAALNMDMCSTVREYADPKENGTSDGESEQLRAAYVAACDWFTRRLLNGVGNENAAA